jgi:predicted RNase H-like HicB family nuclease
MQKQSFTAILEREGDLYVALCPALAVASQGSTVEEATANLKEAVELFLECADPEEIKQRLHNEVFVTDSKLRMAKLRVLSGRHRHKSSVRPITSQLGARAPAAAVHASRPLRK